MSYREVTSSAVDIKKERGKPYVGIYLGSKGITGKFGPQIVYSFQAPDGPKYQIYGFGQLNYVMAMVTEGSLVRITYTGLKSAKTKYGTKDIHQVCVEVDENSQAPSKDDSGNTLPF